MCVTIKFKCLQFILCMIVVMSTHIFVTFLQLPIPARKMKAAIMVNVLYYMKMKPAFAKKAIHDITTDRVLVRN